MLTMCIQRPPVQIHYFLFSFFDVLNLGTGSDGVPSEAALGLCFVDDAMSDGDVPLVHRVHTAVLEFLARASLEEPPTDDEDDGQLEPTEFTRLRSELAKELLGGLRVPEAWPELLRRAARELGHDDPSTLRALACGEYRAITLGGRLRLLSFLCEAAANTLAARRILDARMHILEAQQWDYESAVSAGVLQWASLQHLPRPEPLGRDRNHVTFWNAGPGLIMRQTATQADAAPALAAENATSAHPMAAKPTIILPPTVEPSALTQHTTTQPAAAIPDAAEFVTAAPHEAEIFSAALSSVRAVGGARLSSTFELLHGDGAVPQLRAALDTRGVRECALVNAISNHLQNMQKQSMPTMRHRRRPPVPSGRVGWPVPPREDVGKEASFTQLECPACERRLRGGLTDWLAHACSSCALSAPRALMRPDPLQRLAIGLVALELQIPPLLCAPTWDVHRMEWQSTLKEAAASSAPYALSRIASLVLRLQENIHTALFRPGWASSASKLCGIRYLSPDDATASPDQPSETADVAARAEGPDDAASRPAEVRVLLAPWRAANGPRRTIAERARVWMHLYVTQGTAAAGAPANGLGPGGKSGRAACTSSALAGAPATAPATVSATAPATAQASEGLRVQAGIEMEDVHGVVEAEAAADAMAEAGASVALVVEHDDAGSDVGGNEMNGYKGDEMDEDDDNVEGTGEDSDNQEATANGKVKGGEADGDEDDEDEGDEEEDVEEERHPVAQRRKRGRPPLRKTTPNSKASEPAPPPAILAISARLDRSTRSKGLPNGNYAPQAHVAPGRQTRQTRRSQLGEEGGQQAKDDSEGAGEESEEEDAAEVENPCEVCGGAEDDINTLLCDDCDRPFHIYCLPRPMIAVPLGDWYCADCSDKRAVAARLQARTGCELRCRDKAGQWQVGYMEAMGPEGVLVHYPAHVGVADEWVPLDSGRLRYEGAGFRSRVAEVDEEDDSACAVCGSAGDSENLLLCDSEGCNAAYHTTCLRVPLAQVPEGDWHCELCDEQQHVAHGTLERARALMPDGLRRWRRRVRGARSAAELALLLGAFEGALRLDELQQAGQRARKAHRMAGREEPSPTCDLNSVLGWRLGCTTGTTGGGADREFRVERAAEPPPCSIVLPEGVSPGQKLSCTPPNCRTVQIVVPRGIKAGQKLQVSVPRALWPRSITWCALDAKAPVEVIAKVLEHGLELEAERRRTLDKEAEVRDVLQRLIDALAERDDESRQRKQQLDHHHHHQQQQQQQLLRVQHQYIQHQKHIQQQQMQMQQQQQMQQMQQRRRLLQQQQHQNDQQQHHLQQQQLQQLHQQQQLMIQQQQKQQHELPLQQYGSNGNGQPPAAVPVALATPLPSPHPPSMASWHTAAWPQSLPGQQSASMSSVMVTSPIVGNMHTPLGLGLQSSAWPQQQLLLQQRQQQRQQQQQKQRQQHQHQHQQQHQHQHQHQQQSPQRQRVSSPSHPRVSDMRPRQFSAASSSPASQSSINPPPAHAPPAQKTNVHQPSQQHAGMSDVERAERAVRKDVEGVLERLIVQVERDIVNERRERQKREMKKGREAEQQAEACIERLIRRLERDEAQVSCEDGRPYAEPLRKSRLHGYRVHGIPCTEWFQGNLPESARSVDAETQVRQARQLLKLAQACAQERPSKLPLAWVAPETRRRGWNVICLALGGDEGGE